MHYTDTDRQQAYLTYKAKADLDLSAEECLVTAVQLMKGVCCLQDLELALYFYQKVKRRNCYLSHPQLENLENDIARLNTIQRILAEGGNIISQPLRNIRNQDMYAEAYYYIAQVEISTSRENAIQYLELAANLSHAPAIHWLGQLYQEVSLELAESHFKRGMVLGYIPSVLEYAECIISKKVSKEVIEFCKTMTCTKPEAAYCLASAYMHYIIPNDEEAYRLLENIISDPYMHPELRQAATLKIQYLDGKNRRKKGAIYPDTGIVTPPLTQSMGNPSGPTKTI